MRSSCPPKSALFLPPAAISACVFGAVLRDTRGADLSAEDRVSHFPASPLVAVTYTLQGAIRVLAPADMVTADPVPPCWVVGPTADPVSSVCDTEVCAITVSFYPDAWAMLGGSAAYDCVPKTLEQALAQLNEDRDPQDSWDRFCAALETVWTKQRDEKTRATRGVSDWVRSVLTRAAMSSAGQSLRSYERRLKRSSGHTQRSLMFYANVENLYKVARENADQPLSDIALAAGYSDQSHMGRALRRATGFSPAQLNHAIETEEAFWCYRLLGERF